MEDLLCMIGLHRYRDWVLEKENSIVSTHNSKYIMGYAFYYSAKCKCCGKTKIKKITLT